MLHKPPKCREDKVEDAIEALRREGRGEWDEIWQTLIKRRMV